MYEIVIQINGKIKSKVIISADSTKEEVLSIAKNEKKIKDFLINSTVVKEIYVKGKLVNLVVK